MRTSTYGFVALLALLVLALAACGAASGEDSTPVETATEFPATASPVPTSTSQAGDVPAAVLEAAQTALAAQLAVEEAALTLDRAEARDWSDSALGCPAEGQMYLQVITPGYLLEFSTAPGQTYAVHTTQAGEQLILCQDEQPVYLTSADNAELPTGETPVPATRPTATPVAEDAEEAEEAENAPAMDDVPPAILDRARQSLANHLAVAPEALTLTRAEARDWSDSSLGCPEPGTPYLQVITPGYLLEFSTAPGQTYAVHTTQTGEPLILCQDEQPIMLPLP